MVRAERKQIFAGHLIAKSESSHLLDTLIGVSDERRNIIRLSKKSFYADDVWDLSDEHPDLRPVEVALTISRLVGVADTLGSNHREIRLLRSVKEYLYSLIVDPPAMHPKWSTICKVATKGLRQLVSYMRKSRIYQFSDITELDLELFLEEVSSAPVKGGAVTTDRTLRSRVAGLDWVFEQSSKVEDGLKFDPFRQYGSISKWSNKLCRRVAPRVGLTREIPDELAVRIFECAISDIGLVDSIVEINSARSVHAAQSAVDVRNGSNNIFPWRDYAISSYPAFRGLESKFTVACYILIAMLTGMRFHEIVALRSGGRNNWQEEELEVDEKVFRVYFVVSSTNKLQAEPTSYKWQTVPFVKIVLDSAERGLAARRGGGTFLFPSHNYVNGRISSTVICRQLKEFAVRHDLKFNDSIWALASHQFRKTFARIMTRQGLGIKELQDQLKHFDIENTRIYGDMSLYLELQQEKFKISEEKYDELLSGQVPIIGGGAAEFGEYQKKFLGMTKNEQAAFLQELPKNALIEQVDDGLCMFRSAKALCGGDKSSCRPADCNNSIMPAASKRKVFEWRLRENTRMLEHFKKDPLKVSYLLGRISELNKLISQLDALDREAGDAR
ncbi:site-specific integrase [Pseudomonas sichuanensis]|uniref:site-specific integrase n=1 Tax=Pseudomonas sichuanensis TaxID=2213015 RepID=UPI002160FF89|nr:site-specific integrase [Pseudomonas sichuanensis]UVL89465.1 site-specific integrase [Pseudomonas sichuanensis]